MVAIKSEKTLIELAWDFDERPSQIKQWRDQQFADATGMPNATATPDADPAIDAATLHAKIGGLALGNDFCPARSARRVCCRAQENDRSHIKAQRPPSDYHAGDRPGQRLLSGSASPGR